MSRGEVYYSAVHSLPVYLGLCHYNFIFSLLLVPMLSQDIAHYSTCAW